jgi:hypothetical protein
MTVDDICKIMSLEEANNVVVDFGTCNGWKLSDVAEKRIASLTYYTTAYNGDNNLVRAGARLILESRKQNESS